MISASLSLSLPRLGRKSTSMPRSLKICTAAGDSASEMRTFGAMTRSLLASQVVQDWFEARKTPASAQPAQHMRKGRNAVLRGFLRREGHSIELQKRLTER